MFIICIHVITGEVQQAPIHETILPDRFVIEWKGLETNHNKLLKYTEIDQMEFAMTYRDHNAHAAKASQTEHKLPFAAPVVNCVQNHRYVISD